MIPAEKRVAMNELIRADQYNIAALKDNGEEIARGMKVFKSFSDALVTLPLSRQPR